VTKKIIEEAMEKHVKEHHPDYIPDHDTQHKTLSLISVWIKDMVGAMFKYVGIFILMLIGYGLLHLIAEKLGVKVSW